MASTLRIRLGGKLAPPWRSILSAHVSATWTIADGARRLMAFRPRRTPLPSVAGVNLRPRPNPVASFSPSPSDDGGGARPSVAGGRGRDPGWVSPHHRDHWERLDDSTIDHPQLLHGDPHMPVQQFTRGDGKVMLDPSGGRATELDDYRTVGRKDLLLAEEDGDSGRDRGGDDEDDGEEEDNEDELAREFGSDAADAIRSHLNTLQSRLDRGRETNKYSPLDEVEEQFRAIDRLTAAPGSTQDLALRRRARTESRNYFRRGSIPQEGGRDGGDGADVDALIEGVGAGGRGDKNNKEFGRGRGYDAQSVFSKSAKVHFPYGKDWPSPTYHPDFPEGSGVGNNPNDPDEEAWVKELNKLIYEEKYREFALGSTDETYTPVNVQQEDMDRYLEECERTKRYDMRAREEEHEKDREEKPDEILEMIKNGEDPNQEAFGPWGECTIKVDRVQKVERGGTTVRYRALVIGGNGNGAAGFGVGKALSPNESIIKACKACKRNITYVDRYLGTGLTYDLAGKHNSCIVRIRAVSPDYGLRGHPLVCEILKYAGVSDASSKSHGNRNPYNVVYATFKALRTHESLEEIAMKRGLKLLNLQRARRLGI